MEGQAPDVRFDPLARAVGRLSASFVLDLVAVGRGDRDFLDGLLILTIIQANLAHLQRDAAFQLSYADYEHPPPDEVRRPVSVHALALSLSLPYETVRRRIAALAELGACVLTPKGVYVPAWVVTTPEHRKAVDGSYEVVRAFYRRLRALGLLAPPDLARTAATPADRPVRAVVRASSDYFLRIIELLTAHVGNLVTGLALLSILRGNVAHLDEACAPGVHLAPIPEEARRPVRVRALAAALGVPDETARRHAQHLVEARLCARTPQGLVIPGEFLAQDRWRVAVEANLGYLHRLYGVLAPLGILARWEAEAAVDERSG